METLVQELFITLGSVLRGRGETVANDISPASLWPELFQLVCGCILTENVRKWIFVEF